MRVSLRQLLVTGGAGFIGSEFVRQAVCKGYQITVADSISYAGDLERIKTVKQHISFIRCDITNKKHLKGIFSRKFDAVVHLAAQTHVDRSLKDSFPFIQTNVLGTQNLIELALKYRVKKFVYISTDEVYGQSRRGYFLETSPLSPRNPYSATKAAAELLVQAAISTYGFKAVIVRPCNNYGPWQYPEKFIPVSVSQLLKGKKIPVYGQGAQVREWLHVSDCARGILTILEKGKVGEIYNMGSNEELTNLQTAYMVLKILNKSKTQIQFVPDRLGHDFRYSLNSSKLCRLGWKPVITLSEGIKETVAWYQNHLAWVQSKLQ